MFIEPIIAFLGLIAGFFLNKTVKEELEPGKKYFRILSILLLIILVVISPFTNLVLIGTIIGILLSIVMKNPYFSLGILTMVSTLTGKLALVSSLVFIFGLSYSSWFYRIIDKKYLLESLVLFFIPFFLLFSSKVLLNYDLILGIGIGGCIGIILKGFKNL